VTHDLQAIGDPSSPRPLLLLEGNDPSRWDVNSEGLVRFTLLLAIDGDRYSDNVLSALADRFQRAGLGWLCAWGPGCSRVEFLFDLQFVDEDLRGGMDAAEVMTTSHHDEPLAEALWFAIDLAWHEDIIDPPASPVVIGADTDARRIEIRTRLQDLDELRRYVVEDLPG
jgi:hypothetical protein